MGRRMTRAEGAPDVIAVALDVVRWLERLEVPYLVSGSLASSMHGEPRTTLDVDMVVDLRASQARALVEALDALYYVDLDAVRDAVRDAGSFNAVHLSTTVKVDFFVAGDDAFEAERLRHRLRAQVGPAPDDLLYVDTAEHTLLRKLEWFRRGGEVSERQWRDVEAIVAVQGERLDLDRLTRWARELGVTDLLQRLIARE